MNRCGGTNDYSGLDRHSIKTSVGKLAASAHEVLAGIEPAGFSLLPITGEHAARVAQLPPLHRDPFDRGPSSPEQARVSIGQRVLGRASQHVRMDGAQARAIAASPFSTSWHRADHIRAADGLRSGGLGAAEQLSHSPYSIGYRFPLDCTRATVVGTFKGATHG
jgi:hypothetical protein